MTFINLVSVLTDLFDLVYFSCNVEVGSDILCVKTHNQIKVSIYSGRKRESKSQNLNPLNPPNQIRSESVPFYDEV